jgi:hypothetical protein
VHIASISNSRSASATQSGSDDNDEHASEVALFILVPFDERGQKFPERYSSSLAIG